MKRFLLACRQAGKHIKLACRQAGKRYKRKAKTVVVLP